MIFFICIKVIEFLHRVNKKKHSIFSLTIRAFAYYKFMIYLELDLNVYYLLFSLFVAAFLAFVPDSSLVHLAFVHFCLSFCSSSVFHEKG